MAEANADATMTLLARLVADVDSFKQQMGEVKGSMKDVRTTTQQTALTFSELSGTVFTVFRLLNRIEIANLRLENSQNALIDAQERYNTAVEKFGPNSRQALKALRDIENAERNVETRQRRVMLSYVLVGTAVAAETSRMAAKLMGAGAAALGFANTAAAVTAGTTRLNLMMKGAQATTGGLGSSFKSMGIVALVAAAAFGIIASAMDVFGLKGPTAEQVFNGLAGAFKIVLSVVKMLGAAFVWLVASVFMLLISAVAVVIDTLEGLGRSVSAIVKIIRGDFAGAANDIKKGWDFDKTRKSWQAIQDLTGNTIDAFSGYKREVVDGWGEITGSTQDAADATNEFADAMERVDSRRQDFVRLVYVLRDMNGELSQIAGGILKADIGVAGKGVGGNVTNNNYDNRTYTITNYNSSQPKPSDIGKMPADQKGDYVYNPYK